MINRFCYLVLRLLFLILLMFSVVGHATTVTGTVKVNGSPFTGSLVITLNHPSTNGTYLSLPVPSGPISVLNGNIAGNNASLTLDGNDTLLPSKTYYTFDFFDGFGNEVTKLNYYISGSTYDIGQAIPTPVLTNNINFLDLLGLRSIGTNSLTVNNSFIIGRTIITATGISNAQKINGILFAAVYNIANPSSTTCGIQEALSDLPTGGGIIYLQQGNCVVSSTVNITGPVTILGYGQGGFTDNSTFTTFTAGTTLTASTVGLPLFKIAPNTGTTFSGVTLADFAINEFNGGTFFQIGSSSTSSFLNKVTIRNVFTLASSNCVVDVVGNLAGLLLDHDHFSKGTNSGICFSASGSYAVSGVNIRDTISSRNSVDGIHVASAATTDITIEGGHFDNNASAGLNVVVGSSNTVIKSYGNTYRNNQNNIIMSDGVGSSSSDTLTGASQYGASINTPSSSNTNFSFKDEVWGNTTADIFTGATTNSVINYPSKTVPVKSQSVAGTIKDVIVGVFTAITTGTNGWWRTDIDGLIEEYVNTPGLNTNTTTTVTLPHAIPTSFISCVCSDNSGRVQTGNTQAVGCNVSGQSAPFSTVQILTQASSMTAYCHVTGK
jgi:hypothetical protein